MAKKAMKKRKHLMAAKQRLKMVEQQFSSVPHTFVFNRGIVGRSSVQLMKDLRRVFEPFTSRDLETTRKNTLKDFVTVAGPLGINYFVVVSKSELGNNLRMMRLSRGPTMTFRIKEFTLAKDIASSLKKQSMYVGQFLQPPLLVLNNFARDKLHLKLLSTMFQNMFPPLDVTEVKINDIRRCVLVSYNDDTKEIDFRHYSIKAVPMGVSRCAKKLIQTKVPNLERYHDVAEYFLNTGALSESEAELDGEHNEVTLPQELSSRGNMAKEKSAVRLVEIGPRLKLELIKIEEGISDGEVLYHSLFQKTKEDLAKLREEKAGQKKQKNKRRMKQEDDVEKKQKKKEALKRKSIQGFAKNAQEVEDDDDVEYYRQEVGEDPDPDLFVKRSRFVRPPLKRGADRPMRGRGGKRTKVSGREGQRGDQASDASFSGPTKATGTVFRKSSALSKRGGRNSQPRSGGGRMDVGRGRGGRNSQPRSGGGRMDAGRGRGGRNSQPRSGGGRMDAGRGRGGGNSQQRSGGGRMDAGRGRGSRNSQQRSGGGRMDAGRGRGGRNSQPRSGGGRTDVGRAKPGMRESGPPGRNAKSDPRKRGSFRKR